MNERTNTLLRLFLVLLLATGTLVTLQPLTGDVFSNQDISIGESTLLQRQTEHSILFTGDIMLGRDVETILNRYGADYPFALFLKRPAYAATIGNFEAAIPMAHTQTLPPSLQFSVAASSTHALKQAGFTHLSLANNHSLDFESAGLLHTRSVLSAAGMTPIGDPAAIGSTSVTYITVNDTTVAVVALHTLYGAPQFRELDTLFKEVNRASDVQVAYVHWGEEYEPVHTESQEQLASTLIQLGTDLIVGHHPHVIQDVGLMYGVPVFYSIGNFIFDQYFSDAVQTGLMLELEIRGDEQFVHLVPVSSVGSRVRPRVMPAVEASELLSQLAERSAPGLSTMIREGEIGPLHNLASSQETVIMAE